MSAALAQVRVAHARGEARGGDSGDAHGDYFRFIFAFPADRIKTKTGYNRSEVSCPQGAVPAESPARHARGGLYEKLPEGRVRCFACGHRCLVPPGRDGVCRVRFNEGGILKVPFGYVGAVHVDPVEKKPFFHALPGARALSFGMLGCDYHCGYCQNWLTSQALRDPEATVPPQDVSAGELAGLARQHGARIVIPTYNEPLITSEWAVAVFREARAAGLVCSYVSNGNGTPEVLDYIQPWVSLYKVDLKSFRDRHYRSWGTLERVLLTIRSLHERGIWVGGHAARARLQRLGRGADGHRAFPRLRLTRHPWHVTAFHKDYKMTGPEDTERAHALLCAAETGAREGLRFVYAGTSRGREWEDTR